MANALGYVSETKTGFDGMLSMMNLSAAIRIAKNEEKSIDGQPDYRIFAGETTTEIGGGWLRKPKHQAANMSQSHSLTRKSDRAGSMPTSHPSKAKKVAM